VSKITVSSEKNNLADGSLEIKSSFLHPELKIEKKANSTIKPKHHFFILLFICFYFLNLI
jgi:hypothetical protein